MKGVIAWFAGNSVAANLIMLGIVVLGLGVMPSLRQEVVPTIVVDSVVIQMPYPGAAPEEIEKSICMRIEENVQGLSGVDEVTSTASESMGTVTVKLLFGTDRNVMLADIKSAVDRIDSFPDDAEEPTVSLVDLNNSAMKVVVWGDADARTLREISADIQSGLTGLKNISLVKLINAPAYEMSIEVREQDLRRYGMTFDEVSNAIRQSSLDIPTGSIKTDGGEILLRGKGQAYSGKEFAAITLRHLPNGTDLTLGEVADIRDGFADTDQELRFNGKPAAMIDIFRVGDQDALAIGPSAQKFLDEYKAQLPDELVLSITGDETAMLKDRLSLMLENGAQGLVLVLITLALFLRLRLALWVTVGIPVSFLGGIWLMPYMDVSVNMISLFAFIIVLGIVVDDAIVVAENIHHNRQTERGKKDGLWAATTGASEMSKPVIFAILTTMVAFTPMLFMPGTMGQFSRNIPLIVI
ncbi:MAG: multidrug efflux pump subunit AcrB, partial [Gammaproteobacteria bacterium]